MPSQLLLVAEVADRLRVPRHRVLRLLKKGLLRGINVGLSEARPRWVVEPADLEEFERRRANEPATVKVPSAQRRRLAVPNYFA